MENLTYFQIALIALAILGVLAFTLLPKMVDKLVNKYTPHNK